MEDKQLSSSYKSLLIKLNHHLVCFFLHDFLMVIFCKKNEEIPCFEKGKREIEERIVLKMWYYLGYYGIDDGKGISA